MKDMFGHTLNVGDKVLYAKKVDIHSSYYHTTVRSSLEVGIVEKVTDKMVVVDETRYMNADRSFISLEHMDTFMPDILARIENNQRETEEEMEDLELD